MNIDLRKVVRSQNKYFQIGFYFIIAIVFIQFSYTVYVVYKGYESEQISEIQSYDNQALMQNSTMYLLSQTTFKNIDIDHRFAFYSNSAQCTELGIFALLKSLDNPIHSCASYLNPSGTWLNAISFSTFQLNIPVGFSFALVITVIILCFILLLFIQVNWIIPFYQFQTFALEM